MLVCAACEIEHAALIRRPDLPLGAAAAVLTDFASRRMALEPVARIIGRREFWGLSFYLDESVLDPRADTEGLVGSVLDAVGGRRTAALELLDLGTGSGAILCALLSELPNARGLGMDLSFAACQTAARNVAAQEFAHRANIVCGAWSDGLRGRYDVIVSNPPYIARSDIATLPDDVRIYDPFLALDGGADGLDAYRAIVPQLGALLRSGGIAAFECGWNQGEAVASMLREAGLQGVAIYKDLAGLDRVVLGLASPTLLS